MIISSLERLFKRRNVGTIDAAVAPNAVLLCGRQEKSVMLKAYPPALSCVLPGGYVRRRWLCKTIIG